VKAEISVSAIIMYLDLIVWWVINPLINFQNSQRSWSTLQYTALHKYKARHRMLTKYIYIL